MIETMGRALLFDIDGTLANTDPLHLKAFNQVLAWQDENRESNADAAVYFLRNYESLWTKWVPADVAEKVKASL